MSRRCDFTYGPSPRRIIRGNIRQKAGSKTSGSQEGVAQGDRKPSVSDFHNLDFSGHFKIKLLSISKPSVLKLKVNEEWFVKFCHLFHCELQLEALKQALLSDLKVDVTGEGYPPSICPQEGVPDPIYISINRVLTSLSYQIIAVNISSSSWNTDQVKDTLSLLDSYQKGIVIGYDVSCDDTNCWLVGECGTMRTTIEALGRKIGPFRYQQTYQQEPIEIERNHDKVETTPRQAGQIGLDNGQTGQDGSVRQTEQPYLDRQHRPTGVNADMGQRGSENKALEQLESKIRFQGLPESGDRQSGQSGSSESTTETITRDLKPMVVQGEIAKMTSEVIVNTTRTDLRLDQGAVSLSILKAAGQGIQHNCNQYYGGVKHGEVAVTHGYKLKCAYVFHGALPFYKTENMVEMKVMSQYMRNCLKEADKRKCRTISFPALGTGNLGYPKALVANTMFNAVKKYFQENPDSCVEGVNFVVYHKDRETVKAFEAEDKRQKEKTDEGVNEPVVTESSKNKRGYEIENDRQYPIGKPIGETEGKRIVGLYNEKAEHIKKAFKPPQSNTNQLQEEQWRPINESESPQITTGKMPATEAISKTQGTEMKNQKSTTLEMTEYEEKRLIITSNSHSPLDKRRIEEWLGKAGIQKLNVVCPFQQDTDALIILQSVNDANTLLKQPGAPYIVTAFPCQSVLNIKAIVKNSFVKSIRELLKPDEIAAALYNASGVTWTVDDNGTCYIEGSLLEIHCANRYFSRIVNTQV